MNDGICYTAVVKRHPQFYFEVHTNDKVTLEDLSDELLTAQAAQGNVAALETLYDRYSAIVLGVAFKIIGDRSAAEEVLQETFWRVWQSAGTYPRQHRTFRGWLYSIAYNLAADANRPRGPHPPGVAPTATVHSIPGQKPEPIMNIPEKAKSKLHAQQGKDALTSLPPEERQVIEMVYFYKMTQQEIAAATGERLDTIHTRARLALQKLREELKREIGFEGKE